MAHRQFAKRRTKLLFIFDSAFWSNFWKNIQNVCFLNAILFTNQRQFVKRKTFCWLLLPVHKLNGLINRCLTTKMLRSIRRKIASRVVSSCLEDTPKISFCVRSFVISRWSINWSNKFSDLQKTAAFKFYKIFRSHVIWPKNRLMALHFFALLPLTFSVPHLPVFCGAAYKSPMISRTLGKKIFLRATVSVFKSSTPQRKIN